MAAARRISIRLCPASPRERRPDRYLSNCFRSLPFSNRNVIPIPSTSFRTTSASTDILGTVASPGSGPLRRCTCRDVPGPQRSSVSTNSPVDLMSRTR